MTGSVTQTPFTLHTSPPLPPRFRSLSIVDTTAFQNPEELKCCICWHSFSEKKMSWFQHNSGKNPHYIDNECLDAYFKSKQAEKTPQCPSCKAPFSYPCSIEEKTEKTIKRIFEKSTGAHPLEQHFIAEREFANLTLDEISYVLEKEETLFRRLNTLTHRSFWQHAIMAATVSGNASLLEKATRKIPKDELNFLILNVFLSTFATAVPEFGPRFFAEQEIQPLQPFEFRNKTEKLIRLLLRLCSKASQFLSSAHLDFIKAEQLFHELEKISSNSSESRSVQIFSAFVRAAKTILPTLPSDPILPIFRPIDQDLDKILENFFALDLLNNNTPNLSLMALALASLVDLNLAQKIVSVLDMTTSLSPPLNISFFQRPLRYHNDPQERPLFPKTLRPLHIGALSGSLQLFQSMLEKGASLEEVNRTSDILGLAFVSRYWNPSGANDLINFLLENPIITIDKHTLLEVLATKEPDWIKRVYAKSCQKDVEDAVIETILSGDLSGLTSLTSLGVDLTQIGKTGGSSAIRTALSFKDDSHSKQRIFDHLIECFSDRPIPEEDIADILTVVTTTREDLWLWKVIEKHASAGLACFNTADSEGNFPLSRFISMYSSRDMFQEENLDDRRQEINNTVIAIPEDSVLGDDTPEVERQPSVDPKELLKILIVKGADPSLGTPSIFTTTLKKHLNPYSVEIIPIEVLEILLSSNKMQIDFPFFEEMFKGNEMIYPDLLELLLNHAAEGVINCLNSEGRSLIDLLLERRARIDDPTGALLELLLKRGVPSSIRNVASEKTLLSMVGAGQILLIRLKLLINNWFSK